MKKEEKLKVLYLETDLDYDTEYTIEEIANLVKKGFSIHRPDHEMDSKLNGYEYTHYTISAEKEYEWEDVYVRLKVRHYRTESDNEFKDRLKFENQKRIEEENKLKIAEEKKLKQEALKKDEEYQTFLRLKEKFK